MLEEKLTRKVRRGRLFAEIEWTPEQLAQKQAEDEATYRRCKAVFDSVQPQLIKTHYGWFIAVEPESGDYFINQDEQVVTQMSRQKYPNAIPFVFKINETGACGTL